MIDRPLQGLHATKRAADHGHRPLNAEVRKQAAVNSHEVAHRESRESQSVRSAGSRVQRCRPRGPLAAAKEIRAENEVAVRIDGTAGANDVVPPPAPVRIAVVTGGVSVTGQRVADEDDIVTLR